MKWFIAVATLWAAEKVVGWALGTPAYEPRHAYQPHGRVSRDTTIGMTIDELFGEEVAANGKAGPPA